LELSGLPTIASLTELSHCPALGDTAGVRRVKCTRG
jgi:hypothetical protein